MKPSEHTNAAEAATKIQDVPWKYDFIRLVAPKSSIVLGQPLILLAYSFIRKMQALIEKPAQVYPDGAAMLYAEAYRCWDQQKLHKTSPDDRRNVIALSAIAGGHIPMQIYVSIQSTGSFLTPVVKRALPYLPAMSHCQVSYDGQPL